MQGVEHLTERVGHMLCAATTVMSVVDSLNTATAWNVIFVRGELHLAVVGQVNRGLYEAFPIGTCAHNDSAVEVLKRTGCNLTGACSVVVDQHNDRNDGVDRFGCRLIVAVKTLHFAMV